MADGGGSAQRVLADAQASLFFTMRPYPKFEVDYQGAIGQLPIMFTDQGQPLDPQAGKPGYSPNLVRGLPVPIGARVMIWLPMSGVPNRFGLPEIYNWNLIWRIRSVADFRLARLSYHFPKQGPGVTTTPPDVSPGPRFIMPACMQSIVFHDPGPRGNVPAGSTTPITEQAANRVTVEAYQPQRAVGDLVSNLQPMKNPALPGQGANPMGIIEQGVSDSFSSIFTDQGLPLFVPIDVTALGDELLIACTKPTSAIVQNASNSWDFNSSTVDQAFSFFFGQGSVAGITPPIPDLGVYVSIINAP